MVGLAVNIKKKKDLFCYICYICSKLENKNCKHFSTECPNFPSAQDKLNQLKLLRYCIRCAISKQKSNECNFEFKKLCFYCKGPHMSFLCLNKAEIKKGEGFSTKNIENVKPKNTKMTSNKNANVKYRNNTTNSMVVLDCLNIIFL